MGHPSAGGMSLAARSAFTLLPLAAFLLIIGLLWRHGLPLASTSQWIPALGIHLSWRIDGLSALLLLMITGIGTAVFVYAGAYLAGDPRQSRLYVLLSLFMLAMIGCATADDVFLLFLCWEATSLLSFLLVGFDHHEAGSRKSAQQALLVTGSGGLALLAGLILLAEACGSSQISVIVPRLAELAPSAQLYSAVLLLLVGAFTKSAQFPFHFWLPNAMAAPTPVSAYLHSATMVKLGVFLLARFDAGLDAWPMWQWLLQGAGSLTAAWGMLLTLRERDLKRILAWSTVATLGLLVALVGLPGEDAALAVGALLLAHALYKAPLFFVAGNIDHGTGTRIIDKLGNLRHAMPWTATAAMLASISMAGIPLSFGYVAKGLIKTAKGGEGVLAFAPWAYTLFGAIAVAVAAVAAIRVFWRHPGEIVETPHAHEVGTGLILPPLLVALLGIGLGLFPIYAEPLLAAAGIAMTPGSDPLSTELDLLIGPELFSYVTTFIIGIGLFLLWDPLHHICERVTRAIAPFSFERHYEKLLTAIPRLAASTTRTLQHGHLPGYLGMAIGFCALIAAALLLPALQLSWPAGQWPSLAVAASCTLIGVGALAACLLRDRLTLLLSAGLVGYGSALLFLFTGAPDVAMTQFVVETVFVIVVAAVLLAFRQRGLPKTLTEATWRPRAALLAVALATVLTLALLLAVGQPFDNTLGDWFAAQSLPAAQGRNVVNVILVDFRAIDTLGEISVVFLSLLAAMPLLRRWNKATPGPSSVMLQSVAPVLYWLILLVAVAVLLRGHNEPGGGFIGGLLAVCASTLWALAYGSTAATRRLPLASPVRLGALGVLLALLSGLPGWLAGQAYLTHLWWSPLSTVILFDLGVFCSVWGALGGYALALLDTDHKELAS